MNMTYREKRELRRANALPQFADIVEGFIFGSVFLFVVMSMLTWWVTGKVVAVCKDCHTSYLRIRAKQRKKAATQI